MGTFLTSNVVMLIYAPEKSASSKTRPRAIRSSSSSACAHSLTVCDASEPIPWVKYPMNVRHKAVAKGVARSQIKRFKQEDYVRMYNGGALTNVVNRRIGSKLHQVRLIILI